jgi:hypothetical protein
MLMAMALLASTPVKAVPVNCEPAGEGRTGELRALVRVEDFSLSVTG